MLDREIRTPTKTKHPKTFLTEFGELAKFLRNLEYLVPLIFPLTCHYEKRRDRQVIVRIINQRAMMGYCAREQLRFWSKHATDVVGSPADVQPNNHRIWPCRGTHSLHSARVRGPRVSEEESLGIGRQGHARQHHVCVLSLPQTWHLDLGAAAAATVLAIRTSDRFRSRGTVMCTLKLRIMTPEFL